MQEYVQPLGDSVKRARIKAGMTQKEVADAIHIDDRTVLNIENHKGNPKMEILFPWSDYYILMQMKYFTPKRAVVLRNYVNCCGWQSPAPILKQQS